MDDKLIHIKFTPNLGMNKDAKVIDATAQIRELSDKYKPSERERELFLSRYRERLAHYESLVKDA